MELLVASLASEHIRTARAYGVRGVITNPTTFEDDPRPWRTALSGAVAEDPTVVHVQVTAHDLEGMVGQAHTYRDIVGERLVVKVPVGEAGLQAAQLLREEGVRTNVTAVVSGTQAILAAQAGADYISVYVGRIDRVGADGVEVLDAIAAYLRRAHPGVGLVAASIHNLRQLFGCALAGATHAAVEPEMIVAASQHELTDAGIAAFDQSWNNVLARGA